jgi:hypothetical protein
MTAPIHDVIKVLESLGLTVTLCEKNEDVPFDVALAPLGFDEMNRSLVLQIQQYTQNIATAVGIEIETDEENPPNTDLQMLHFLVTVTVEIPEETIPDVLRLLALANKTFPLGALNFSEIEKSVYFSYGYPVFSTPPCEMTILMIVNTILHARDTFFSIIDEVASYRQTVDSLLEIHQK